MKTSASQGPVAEILVAYWKSDWRALLAVAAIVLLSSAYLFPRLIDQLPKQAIAADLLWAFIVYATLIGFASAVLRVVQNMSVMTAENPAEIRMQARSALTCNWH
jgi:ATP-binding cassette subfamily B protein